MNDAEFQSILDQLSLYLAKDKTFIINPVRETEFKKAIEIATLLFPNAKLEVKSDPLEVGAGILRIESYEINISGEREINLFSELINFADNFEIYPIDNGNIRFAVVFEHVLVRI